MSAIVSEVVHRFSSISINQPVDVLYSCLYLQSAFIEFTSD